MPRILSVAPAQGLVVEDEIYIPDALNVYWPAGTVAHFWYRRDGANEVWSIDTGWGRGAVPGETIVHVAALGFYNWPSHLDYVWRDPVTLRLHHVDILGESVQQLVTRDDEGNAIDSDFQGKPFAHPNGSFYWTEGTSGGAVRMMVRWSPTVDSSPRVLANVDIGTGSTIGYESNLHEALFVRSVTYGCDTPHDDIPAIFFQRGNRFIDLEVLPLICHV